MSGTELAPTPRGSTEVAPRPSPTCPLPRLVVAGGTGRLGSAIVHGAVRAGFPVTAIISGRPPPLGEDRAEPGETAAARVPHRSRSELSQSLEEADVFVSAATPQAEAEQLPLVASLRVPAVIATTGLPGTPAEEALDAASRWIPIVVDSNFSVGAHLLLRAAATLGPLPAGYDLSITETHRREKRDHPSGTAQAIARALAPSGVAAWATARGEREPGTVEIASLRAGEVPGIHALQVAGPHEVLRFEHIVFGREAFVEGVLEAARWLYAPTHGPRPAGRYGLEDVLASRRSAPTAEPRP